jgi:hypothetical protein
MKLRTTTRDARPARAVTAATIEGCVHEDIRVASCSELEWILVRTHNTDYEIIVLSAATGEVMVRGGTFFTHFRPATVAGSILGDISVALGAICLGSHLELRIDGKSFVTSRVEAVLRSRLGVVHDGIIAAGGGRSTSYSLVDA